VQRLRTGKTHEAAIGNTMDKRNMGMLMAYGLSPEDAVAAIMKGMAR